MTPQQHNAFVRNLQNNRVAASLLKADVMKTIKRIKADAELQALFGDAADNLIQHAGQLLYAAAHAADLCKVPEDTPEVRIMRGMSQALGELAEDRDTLEQHRPAIQSGLAAIERLMPRLSAWSLGLGLIACQDAIAACGFGTKDIEAKLTHH